MVVGITKVSHKRHTRILPPASLTCAGKLEPHIVSIGSTIGETVACGMLLCKTLHPKGSMQVLVRLNVLRYDGVSIKSHSHMHTTYILIETMFIRSNLKCSQQSDMYS